MPRIAIIGAGIAGLNAALTLQRAGHSCEVYEASERVGGRMRAVRWADGMVSEAGGEFIDSGHETLHELVARFGLATVPLDSGHGGGASSLLYFLGRFYGANELNRDAQAIAPTLNQQFQDAGYPTTYNAFTPEGLRLDQLSAHAWIEQYVPGGHASALGRFLACACSGIYGLESEELSALNLVYLFGSRDLSRGSVAPSPMQGSSKIVGGNERLPQAMARSLPEGSVHLGQRLVALERTGDAAVTLTLADAANEERQVQCEYVILALPFSALRRVDYRRAGFDALKQTAIERLGYGTISKLCLQFDMPYWRGDGPWPASGGNFVVTDLAIQTLWDASLGQSGAHGLLMDYTSGRRGAAYAPPSPYATTDDSPAIERYAQECLAQLERVFPGISAHYTGRAALSYPTGDPNLLGSYSCWRVGQYTQFAGYEGVRQGPLFFAGEHCSLEFQGYMEGAAREGARAANEVARALDAH